MLPGSAVWLSIDSSSDGTGDMHALLPQVAALARFAADVDARLAALGGIAGALGVHTAVRAVLDSIGSAEFAEIRAALARLEEALDEIARSLATLARLKEQLGA